jgi:imidazolonepropionase-like amidohydrolase
MDDETIALFKSSSAILVPTLCTLFSVLELGSTLNLPPKQREEMIVNAPLWLDTLKRARMAGIPIAAGGDIGNRYPQGSNAREIAHLVKAGLSPMEALCAATSVASRVLRREKQTGTIEVGKAADLLLVDGDPLADIECLLDPGRIALVVKNGRAASGSLAPHTAGERNMQEALVAAQVPTQQPKSETGAPQGQL